MLTTGTFHPSFGFSHCGKYLFGTVSLEEAEESEVYDEPEMEVLNSDRGDSDVNEPNFDEPTSDVTPANPRSTDHELDDSNLGQSSKISSSVPPDPEGLKSPWNDAAFRGMDENHSQDSPSPGSSPVMESDVASEVGTKKYQWPKLYKLPSELRHPVPEDQPKAVKLKLGSFYVQAPHMYRLRLSENMGILYLDQMQSDDAGRIGRLNVYRSRILCIVPDAFLDLSTTEIVLVWPQGNSGFMTSESQPSAKDTTVKVVLFPSGRSNIPVLINTGLQGPNLLNF